MSLVITIYWTLEAFLNWLNFLAKTKTLIFKIGNDFVKNYNIETVKWSYVFNNYQGCFLRDICSQ